MSFKGDYLAVGTAMKMAGIIPFELKHLDRGQAGIMAHRGAYVGTVGGDPDAVATGLIKSLVDVMLFQITDVTADRVIGLLRPNDLAKITVWLNRKQYQQIAELLLKILRKDSDSITEAVRLFGEKYRSAKKVQPLLGVTHERLSALTTKLGGAGGGEKDSGAES